jgi:hypothetical protein
VKKLADCLALKKKFGVRAALNSED